MRGRPRKSITWLRSAFWSDGCPDMGQKPVGQPAATAARNFATPLRRSSLKRLGPFSHCRQRYIRSLRRIHTSRLEHDPTRPKPCGIFRWANTQQLGAPSLTRRFRVKQHTAEVTTVARYPGHVQDFNPDRSLRTDDKSDT